MNTTLSRQPDPAADEAASLWAARLEGGTLSAPDREALDAWLNADVSHRPLLSRYCQFSADLEEQLLSLVATGGVTLPPEPDSADDERGVEPTLASHREPPLASATVIKVSRWNFTRVASLALAAAAAIAVGVWVARPSVRIESVITATAQRSSITLTDGTHVELNARTSLTFENGAHERHAKLAGGEAFFTVAKDQARPFIIDTPAGSVRVTGTVFNVRADSPHDLEVTVVEGSVQVRPGDAATNRATDPYALVANDCLSIVDGQAVKHTLSPDELNDRLAWRKGVVVFRDVPLRDVVKRLADYHGKPIFQSAGIDQSKDLVKGPFNIDDLESSLATLAESFKLDVTHEASGTIRVKLKAER